MKKLFAFAQSLGTKLAVLCVVGSSSCFAQNYTLTGTGTYADPYVATWPAQGRQVIFGHTLTQNENTRTVNGMEVVDITWNEQGRNLAIMRNNAGQITKVTGINRHDNQGSMSVIEGSQTYKIHAHIREELFNTQNNAVVTEQTSKVVTLNTSFYEFGGALSARDGGVTFKSTLMVGPNGQPILLGHLFEEAFEDPNQNMGSNARTSFQGTFYFTDGNLPVTQSEVNCAAPIDTEAEQQWESMVTTFLEQPEMELYGFYPIYDWQDDGSSGGGGGQAGDDGGDSGGDDGDNGNDDGNGEPGGGSGGPGGGF